MAEPFDPACPTAPPETSDGGLTQAAGWTAAEAVDLIARETGFQGYFRVDRYRLRHRLFEGGWTPPFAREVFERGHAAAVLLYDPRRDQVVLIEQFRIGAYAAGWHPWLIEIVAGIIGPGEEAEGVVRREAMEEAGCRIGRMERIADYLVSPGGTSETVAVFCGEVDASTAGGVHGLVDEHENIRVGVVSTDQAIAWLDDRLLTNGITVVALSWLARHRERLRSQWQCP